jgi:hypothetical protein
MVLAYGSGMATEDCRQVSCRTNRRRYFAPIEGTRLPFFRVGPYPLVTWDHVSYSSLFVPQTPLTPWSMQSPQIRVLTHGYAAAATLKAALAAPRAETASTLRA